VNKISNIIPNSSDAVSSSGTPDSGSRHCDAGSDVERWTDEDALNINVINSSTGQVRCVKYADTIFSVLLLAGIARRAQACAQKA